MSIWSSIGNPIGVADLHAPTTDNYQGTGEQLVELDVAHVGGFHEGIRLAAWSIGATPLDVSLMLDREAVRQLRDKCDEALRITAPTDSEERP